MDSVEARTDKALVNRLMANDQTAFDTFFNEYFSKLYRFAKKRLHHESDVEDVVQVTLANAFRSLHQFRGDAALFSWLCQICKHEISHVVKKNVARETHLVSDAEEGIGTEVAELASPHAPEAIQSQGDLVEAIQNVLDALPANYADVLEWKYIYGESVEEIAARLSSTTLAAQSMLARARTQFKKTARDSQQTELAAYF